MPIHLPIRAAVTGGSGYIGGNLIRLLQDDPEIAHVLDIDVIPPSAAPAGKFAFVQASVGNPKVSDIFREHGINALVHLAFIVNPAHDESEMRRINVDGSANLLRACAECGIHNIVVASSGVTYGAKPGRSGFLSEDHPLDEGSPFSYAAHKVELEKFCRAHQVSHPEAVVKLVRPSVVIGPNVDNYLSRYLQKRFVFTGRGFDPPIQFIHEADAAGIFRAALKADTRGAFNACADGAVPFSELAGLLGREPIPVHVPLLKFLTALGWKARLSWIAEVPAGLVDYILYPWLMSNERVKNELGYRFQFTSREALREFLQKNPKARKTEGK